jgi:DNA polymerase III delta prime subunit
MLYEKHKPIFLDDFKIHLNLLPKLQTLCKKDISNILIYGQKGIGKMTIVRCLLNTHFNTNIITKNIEIKINSIELKFNSSNYYFEIILNNYYNRKKFEEVLLYLCEGSDINNKFKLIIIKNIDVIDELSFKIIKSIIEKKHDSIRFILISSNISNLNNFIKGNFLLLRVPFPDKIELFHYVSNIYPNVKNSKIKSTIDESNNLNDIFISLEISKILPNYVNPYRIAINKLIKLIEGNTINNILKIRDELYNIMSKNYDLKIISNGIYNHFLKSSIENNNKTKIIELFTEYDDKNKSFKDIINIESLLINLMNLY